jgi:hypothetical protein
MAVFSTAFAMPLARLALARTPDERSIVDNRIAPVPGQQI